MKDKIKKLARYAFNRMKEPSTWASVAAIGAVAGANPGTMQAIVTSGPVVSSLVAALLGIFLAEKGPQQ